ncbi:MAG: hypothetical protein ACLR8P_01150 [Clostridium fessum]
MAPGGHPCVFDRRGIHGCYGISGNLTKVSPRELAKRIIRTVLEETGITATAGIGTNLYLCKVAMDIVAKHVEANKDGVRIAELDEQSYRELCGRMSR